MEITAKDAARKIGVSRSRLSQIVTDLKRHLGKIKKIGNVQVFTPEQVAILRNRNKKRGPQTK